MAPDAFPELLTTLRNDFRLVPNYDRALDGRVVDTRFDPATKQLRNVTDRELVALIIGPAYGGQFFQTWYFVVDGIHFQFNQAFESWRYHGLRYQTACRDCGEALWVPIYRQPRRRCLTCHQNRSTTPTCPESDDTVRCSTAYVKHHCRCATCREWNATRQRQRRARNNPVSSKQQLQEILREESYFPVVTPRTNRVVTPPENEHGAVTWTWLPASLRNVLARYEAAVENILVQEAA